VPIQVLLVEDNPGDIRLTREAFRVVLPSAQVHVTHDGLEAMNFLRRLGVNFNSPRPDFMLLDLNLPKIDGLEVLVQIKANASLKTIPIFIVSTSKEGLDIAQSHGAEANCFLRKPVTLDDYETLVRSIVDFWVTNSKWPHPISN
jgi:two-component system, chemotaxis family, response regulator Rcp1